MKNQASCPAKIPGQLSACSVVTTCPYNQQCCPRCANQKQVCVETQAECDGSSWEIQTPVLVCPDCEDYYYDDAYGDDSAPSAPLNVTATHITQTSADLSWPAPKHNFKVGDGYSVAYAVKSNGTEGKMTIQDTITTPHTSITGLSANTMYRLSVLPVANQTVGAAGTLEFKNSGEKESQRRQGEIGRPTSGQTCQSRKALMWCSFWRTFLLSECGVVRQADATTAWIHLL